MSILQFLRIIWAHRVLIAATMVATIVGAGIAILAIPPNYEARTRVMLNTLKPDPVTGAITPDASSRTYIATQIELIRDFGVVGQLAKDRFWRVLGLRESPRPSSCHGAFHEMRSPVGCRMRDAGASDAPYLHALLPQALVQELGGLVDQPRCLGELV